MQRAVLVSLNLACILIGTMTWFFVDNATNQQDRKQLYPISRRLLKQYRNYLNYVEGTNITIDDIHITVKTTGNNHRSRVNLLAKTWIKSSKVKVAVITDTKDEVLRKTPGISLLVTDCRKAYHPSYLCCKTGSEFNTFMESNKSWWCHFDDDVYVNTKALLKLLQSYSSNSRYYIGKRSVTRGIKVRYKGFSARIQFGTGAGYCVTKALAKCMSSLLSGRAMIKTCEQNGLHDDVAIAFVSAAVCGTNLTESDLFHSHFERLASSMWNSVLDTQIVFTYKYDNVTPFRSYQPAFNRSEDPTRFLSIHCMLYPSDKMCPIIKRQQKKGRNLKV